MQRVAFLLSSMDYSRVLASEERGYEHRFNMALSDIRVDLAFQMVRTRCSRVDSGKHCGTHAKLFLRRSFLASSSLIDSFMSSDRPVVVHSDIQWSFQNPQRLRASQHFYTAFLAFKSDHVITDFSVGSNSCNSVIELSVDEGLGMVNELQIEKKKFSSQLVRGVHIEWDIAMSLTVKLTTVRYGEVS